MPRQKRVEIEGGLYHIITRGNDRRDIFHSVQDHEKFLSLVWNQKTRLPFFLYAYCLMTNHIHLLIERQTDNIGRIMHRVLTGYSQYYNRRYKKVGHVFQGRHKAIFCQSEMYMGELVRYIHLNPVRAKMVATPEQYPFSSHRAYLGTASAGMIDVDSVLRLFAAKRGVARREFQEYVNAGIGMGSREEFYSAEHGILGNEEFVDATIHRIGDAGRAVRPTDGRLPSESAEFDPRLLVDVIERICGVERSDFCGSAKSARVGIAKEMLIVTGRRLGSSMRTLSETTGLSLSNISRRNDNAIRKIQDNETLSLLVEQVTSEYEKIAKSQA